MKTFVSAFRRALLSGSLASVASAAALLHGGVRDCHSAIAPVNAVSHWLWKDKALRQNQATLRYTLAGYGIHHAASIFWAMGFEWIARNRNPRYAATDTLARAAAIAALACVVDLRCTPQRLTPGFERRLEKSSLARVYLAFGIGLALHSLVNSRRR